MNEHAADIIFVVLVLAFFWIIERKKHRPRRDAFDNVDTDRLSRMYFD